MQSKSLTQQFLALLRVSRLTREIMEEQKKNTNEIQKVITTTIKNMLEPKISERNMDEVIKVGDYVVTENREVGQVTEVNRRAYTIKVLNSFPPKEWFCRHDQARKCYPAPLRKFKEGDVVICRGLKGDWIVQEDEAGSILICIKDEITGDMKAVSPANLLLIRPIDLRPRFHVIEGVLWDTIENLPLSPSAPRGRELPKSLISVTS